MKICRFSYLYVIIFCTNRGIFFLFTLIPVLSYFFYYISLGHPVQCWIKSYNNKHLYFINSKSHKILFSKSCKSLLDTLFKKFGWSFFICNLWGVLNHKWLMNCIARAFCICYKLSFYLLLLFWYGILIYFVMLSHLCLSGINPA